MTTLSSLLAQRRALLEKARLANLAFAYARLGDFASRLARAQIRGELRLQQAAPDAECYGATLSGWNVRPSVIAEHFTDEDLMDFADAVAFATGENHLDLRFDPEEFDPRFLAPLRQQLVRSGVRVDPAPQPPESAPGEGHGDCPRAEEGR